MRYTDEESIKRELGISTWRELSKDHMLSFVTMMPEMNTDVALKIIEQFPSFKEFAKSALDAIGSAHGSTLADNQRSSEHVHAGYAEIRAIIAKQLDRDDLTSEDRRYFVEQLQETGRRQYDKDTENKQFLNTTMGKVVIGVAGVAALGIAALGGRVTAQRGVNRPS